MLFPRSGQNGGHESRRSIDRILWVFFVLLAGTGVALLIYTFAYRAPEVVPEGPEAPKEIVEEDPLALYQLASDLHRNGRDESALEMLGRARRMTRDERAHRQIEALERRIRRAQSRRENVDGGDRPSAPPATTVDRQIASPIPPPVEAQPEGSRQTSAAVKAARTADRRRRGRAVRRRRARRPGFVHVSADAPAEVLVDGRPTGRRTPARVRISPGSHVIEVVSLDGLGQRASQQVQVVRGKSIRVELKLPVGAKAEVLSETESKPAIGTVAKKKTVIGLIGDDAPARPQPLESDE